MNEEQFSIIETLVFGILEDKDKANEELTIPTREIVLALRDRLGIT